MSQTAEAAFLLNSRGTSRELEAFVVAARFSRDGRHVGFALGDGTVRRCPDPAQRRLEHCGRSHDGAILDFATDPAGDGFISGGDDGKLNRIAADGSVSNVGSFGMKWVEHVATFALDSGGATRAGA